jgi:dolichyl-phosphate-mannose--protein O-mannosyl transferase
MAPDTTAPPDVEPLPEAAPADEDPGFNIWAVVLPLLLLLLAAVIRFYGLGYPDRIYFDETYYAPQGREMITRGVEEGFAVHPPLGKWLIGAGISLFGYTTFGFRAASAAAGSIMVLATYFVGLQLFRRRGLAALGALFVALDGLALTMSRISMLDIFLAMFVALGVWFLLLDRQSQWRRVPTDPFSQRVVLDERGIPEEPFEDRPLPRLGHVWRWAAGITLGLALATKWSALTVIGGAGLFVLISEALWRRRLTGSIWTEWWRPVGSAALTLLLVPLLVYLVSYSGWFLNYEDTRLGLKRCAEGTCDLTAPQIAGEWLGEQREIARFHFGLDAKHPYRSLPQTWPILGRPVAYYYESCSDTKLAKGECVTAEGKVEEILGVGNPAIWWMALAAIPILLWFGVRRRDWRAFAILGFYAVQYLPWLIVPRPNFLFYLTPAVPFICLTLVYATWRLGEKWWGRWVPVVVVTVVVSAFLFWFPIWMAMEIPQNLWRQRMWFSSWI